MQPSQRILFGNVGFAVCCVFYLAWWVLAFRPTNPIQGFRTGWLLIPAAITGIAGVVLIIRGALDVGFDHLLFRDTWVVVGWVAAYIVLMLVTSRVWQRPVTSELLLITGWTALALVEVNALFGAGALSHTTSLVFVLVIAVVLVGCLVCYTLFYRLGPLPRFVDGMIPLLATGLVMVALSICLRTR